MRLIRTDTYNEDTNVIPPITTIIDDKPYRAQGKAQTFFYAICISLLHLSTVLIIASIIKKQGYSYYIGFALGVLFEILLSLIFQSSSISYIAYIQKKAGFKHILRDGKKLIYDRSSTITNVLASILFAVSYVFLVAYNSCNSQVQTAMKDTLTYQQEKQLANHASIFRNDSMSIEAKYRESVAIIEKRESEEFAYQRSIIQGNINALEKEISWCIANGYSIGDRRSKIEYEKYNLLRIKSRTNEIARQKAESLRSEKLKEALLVFNNSIEPIYKQIEKDKKGRIELAKNYSYFIDIILGSIIIFLYICYYQLNYYLIVCDISFAQFLRGEKQSIKYIKVSKEIEEQLFFQIYKEHRYKRQDIKNYNNRRGTGENDAKLKQIEKTVEQLGYYLKFDDSIPIFCKKIA